MALPCDPWNRWGLITWHCKLVQFAVHHCTVLYSTLLYELVFRFVQFVLFSGGITSVGLSLTWVAPSSGQWWTTKAFYTDRYTDKAVVPGNSHSYSRGEPRPNVAMFLMQWKAKYSKIVKLFESIIGTSSHHTIAHKWPSQTVQQNLVHTATGFSCPLETIKSFIYNS